MPKICIVGDIHGEIDLFVRKVKQVEIDHGKIDLVLQVGDFGVFPIKENIDEKTISHGGSKDFEKYYYDADNNYYYDTGNKFIIPWSTYIIEGNHDDHKFLRTINTNQEIFKNLRFIKNGEVAEIQLGYNTLRVGALGKVFSPVSYKMPIDEYRACKGKPMSHIHKSEVDGLINNDLGMDILLIHDFPVSGMSDEVKNSHRMWPKEDKEFLDGLTGIIEEQRPEMVIGGHYHWPFEISPPPMMVRALAKINFEKSILLFDMFFSEWDGWIYDYEGMKWI